MSTAAPGSTAPVRSRTRTSMRPVCTCARAGAAQTTSMRMTADNLIGLLPGIRSMPSSAGLFREPIEDVDELRETLRPLRIALGDAIRHALFDVETEHRETDAVERGF